MRLEDATISVLHFAGIVIDAQFSGRLSAVVTNCSTHGHWYRGDAGMSANPFEQFNPFMFGIS